MNTKHKYYINVLMLTMSNITNDIYVNEINKIVSVALRERSWIRKISSYRVINGRGSHSVEYDSPYHENTSRMGLPSEINTKALSVSSTQIIRLSWFIIEQICSSNTYHSLISMDDNSRQEHSAFTNLVEQMMDKYLSYELNKILYHKDYAGILTGNKMKVINLKEIKDRDIILKSKEAIACMDNDSNSNNTVWIMNHNIYSLLSSYFITTDNNVKFLGYAVYAHSLNEHDQLLLCNMKKSLCIVEQPDSHNFDVNYNQTGDKSLIKIGISQGFYQSVVSTSLVLIRTS